MSYLQSSPKQLSDRISLGPNESLIESLLELTRRLINQVPGKKSVFKRCHDGPAKIPNPKIYKKIAAIILIATGFKILNSIVAL